MTEFKFLESVKNEILDGLEACILSEKDFKITFPFLDASGENIAIGVTPTDRGFLLDDLGHSAGLLFQLGQHGEDSVSHQLIKNLCNAFDINMDYTRGLLLLEIPKEDINRALDFVKVVISIQTTIPEIPAKRRERRTGRRLGSILGNEIRQLRLLPNVQRQTEIQGKNEKWIADYQYTNKMNGGSRDVIIVAADLQWGEPREKAAHVVTLAMDVLTSVQYQRDLRIVYMIGENGHMVPSRRAAELIKDNQQRVGYRAYNYQIQEEKQEFIQKIGNELSGFALSI
jgi:hypothetical protein